MHPRGASPPEICPTVARGTSAATQRTEPEGDPLMIAHRFRTSLVALPLLYAPLTLAAEPKLDAANTAWMITASALVLFMTLPGLALFYAGLVRSRNVLSVLMQCFAITCVVTLAWVIAGYSIAFGEGNAWWGGLARAFLGGIDVKAVKGS